MKITDVRFDEDVGDYVIEIDGTICTFFGPKGEELAKMLINIIDPEALACQTLTSSQSTG